jgi:hypothetical protein
MSRTILNLTIYALAWLFALTTFAAGDGGEWRARWDQTVAAAKKESQLSIYGGEEITHPEIIGEFRKEFPDIKVVTVSGHSEVIQRIGRTQSGQISRRSVCLWSQRCTHSLPVEVFGSDSSGADIARSHRCIEMVRRKASLR